ncbi:MAG: hypothetical protein ACYDAQ_14805 [Mycobacteriales bacterium]
MLKRLGVLAATTSVAVLVLAGVAQADGGQGVTVTCEASDPLPGCTVAAQTPGQPGGGISSAPVTAQGGVSGGGLCHGALGQVAPCSLPGYGWLGSNGCYYQLDTTWQPPVWDTADQPPAGQAGAFYDMTCLGVSGTGVGIVWLAAGSVGGQPLPAPGVLAQQATNQLGLTLGTIEASPAPGADQLVNLPTWVWLASWAPVSASATVPGESVTATARPTSATWTFGDGSRVVCRGPGTPYTAADSPNAPSPTCGHTYTTSSAGEPGGAYPVQVTVSWSISWVGGGRRGTEPAIQTSTATRFRVAESQAVNTTPSSAS